MAFLFRIGAAKNKELNEAPCQSWGWLVCLIGPTCLGRPGERPYGPLYLPLPSHQKGRSQGRMPTKKSGACPPGRQRPPTCCVSFGCTMAGEADAKLRSAIATPKTWPPSVTPPSDGTPKLSPIRCVRVALGWHSGGPRVALGWHSGGSRVAAGWFCKYVSATTKTRTTPT